MAHAQTSTIENPQREQVRPQTQVRQNNGETSTSRVGSQERGRPGEMGDQQKGSDQQQKPGQQGDTSSGSTTRMAPPIVVLIDANGRATVRGTLLSVSSTTITIQSWGLQFVVDATNAQIVGKVSTLASFAVGDIIGVQGTLSQSSPGTLIASTIRDWGTFQNQKAMMRGRMGIGPTTPGSMMNDRRDDRPEGLRAPATTTEQSDRVNGSQSPLPIKGLEERR
jgi:hypothetical protein